MVKEKVIGIEMKDLVGSLVKVRYVGMTSGQTKRGQDTRTITISHDDKNIDFGVIGEKNFDCLLSHGTKEDGQIYFEIPEQLLGQTPDGKIQWLNFTY